MTKGPDTGAARAARAFRERFGADAPCVSRAPGRVNLIGEHTDYNEGFVLPMAVEHAVYVAFRPRADRRVRLWSDDYREECEFALDDVARLPAQRGAGWAEYARGVAWALADAGLPSGRGMDAVIAGEVPVAAGLSSSAATELALARALVDASGIEWEPARMARVCQRAENEWVGVQCGIMDQMVSAVAQQGHCLLIDCRSLDTRQVPMPKGAAVVVLDTGTRRELSDSAYNERREQCTQAAVAFGKASLRDVYMGMLAGQEGTMPAVVFRRGRHVVFENARTIAAAHALERGALETFGALMDESHVSLRDDFEVSSPALDRMVEIARAQRGCYGARMTGAGFGGCAVALVRADDAVDFAARVKAAYDEETGKSSAVYVTQAAAGASLIPAG